jgi:hypothetical protein
MRRLSRVGCGQLLLEHWASGWVVSWRLMKPTRLPHHDKGSGSSWQRWAKIARKKRRRSQSEVKEKHES